MSPANWQAILESWSAGTKELTKADAEAIVMELDHLTMYFAAEVKAKAEAGDPASAIGLLSQLSAFLSAAAQKLPSLAQRAGKVVNKLVAPAKIVAKSLGANSVSIGVNAVGIPSIGFSYPV